MSRKRPPGRGPRNLVILLAVALVSLPQSATAANGGYVYREDRLPPLLHAEVEVIQGSRVAEGCEFPGETKTLDLSIGERWEVRDIAVDMSNCRKLQESGAPTVIRDPEPVDSTVSSDLAMQGKEAVREPTEGTLAPASTGARYVVHRVWWSDLLGFTLNYDETRSSWVWTVGGCVIAGNGYGDWGWLALTGWHLVSNGGGSDLNCSRFYAYTYSHFQNTSFCSGVSVDTQYYYVRNYGYSGGGLTTTRSSQTYRACLPVFMNYQVVG